MAETGSPRVKFGKFEIEAPKWDGKLVLAAILFIGYYLVAYRLTDPKVTIPKDNIPLIRDQLLVLGPAIGVVVGALFRTTAADERSAARRDDTLKTAIETPTTVMAPGAPGSAEQLGDQVREGAEKGARDGVSDGLTLNDSPPPARDDDEPEILR